MNDVLPIARDAVRTLWTHKRLWLFGFFVAAGSGGGAQLEAPAQGLGDAPGWMVALIVLAAVLGLVALGLHVVSEGALIDAVREERRGRTPALGRAWRRGLSVAGRVLGLKLLTAAATTVTVALAAAPALLGVLGLLPLALGAVLTALLLLVAVPIAVSLYLAHEVGLRMIALERRGAIDALRAGLRFLRGRLRFALKLLVLDGAAQIVTGILAAPFALLGLGLGFGVYAVAGEVPAILIGTLVALPVAVAVAGVRGTFRSALWTHGFLDEQPAVS